MSDPERPPVPPVPPADGTVEPERNGPLISERHRKTDGRLLILYRAARSEDPSVSDAQSAGEDR
jgi:hypothetical protein